MRIKYRISVVNQQIEPMTNTEFTIRVLVALLAGFIIGFERQWHHKSAGLRTNTLVAVGSALYVLLSIMIIHPNGDITRVIGQVVTGIGFLCAGVIFREGISVHGLTTAVTIWCSSSRYDCTKSGSRNSVMYFITPFVLIPFDEDENGQADRMICSHHWVKIPYESTT